MTKDNNITGRTFFDLISENKKLTIITIAILIFIICVIVYLGVHVKIGNIEIGQDKKDTIGQNNSINEIPIIIENEVLKGDNSKIKIKESPTQNLPIKTHETEIKVQNQTTKINNGIKNEIIGNNNNTNIGTNNGVIGNYNNINVNIGDTQRKLDEESKKQILILINQTVSKYNINDICIKMSALLGNSEAYIYAKEILNFLKIENIKVDEEINQVIKTPSIEGINVDIYPWSFNKKCIEIHVGYK